MPTAIEKQFIDLHPGSRLRHETAKEMFPTESLMTLGDNTPSNSITLTLTVPINMMLMGTE